MASAKGLKSSLDLIIRPNACSPNLGMILSVGLRPTKSDSPDHFSFSRTTFRSILFRKFTNKFITDIGIRESYGLADHSCWRGQLLENLLKGAWFVRKTNAYRFLISNPHDLM